MSTKSSSDLIDHLRRLSQSTLPEPFTSEEIEKILSSYGPVEDLSQYRNPRLVHLLKELHAEQLACAEANFCEPARMHTLGELLESVLVLKGLFISQLAQQTGIAVEDLEAYIEMRPPAQPLHEIQLERLAESSGLALEEIRRIAAETARQEEKQSSKTNRASTKPARAYRFDQNSLGGGMIRDAED